ncbi:TonB-dependent siderophore receptor [Flavihumibacter sp. ZG627]|uniref:TonB-dependent receptor plug domain-containing protein n=1 Tax=Flavihumibacter sp. ZG627 TaxID=1463156 RepID=UPI00057F39C3|nr:TonB-dependent receptor [Flavihumibacter sp. ZG627]KIC89584.1 hypothetical protein HY58_15830 [Flavihumibacter sp. ZG627]
MKRIILICVLKLFVAAAYSQEDSTVGQLKEVVITAQRRWLEAIKIPYLVETVIGRDIDDWQPRTTPESLVGLNGVFLQKTNHGGGSPFVRGLTGNQLLLLVDGVRLNNSTFRYGPNQYLNTIDPYNITRIEVVKGTGSVQYGSDALGGVIQVFTREPYFRTFQTLRKWHGSVLGKIMSSGMEQTGRASMEYSADKVAAVVGLTYRNFGDVIGGDTTGKQSPSGYDEFAWDAKIKFYLSDSSRLTVAHQFLKQSSVPLFHKVALENFRTNHTDPQLRSLQYVKLDLDGRTPILKALSVTASFQHNIEARKSNKIGSNTIKNERDLVNVIGLSADLSSDLKPWWTANSGLELYYDLVYSERNEHNDDGLIKAMRGLYPDDSRYGNYSLYSLHHFSWKKFSAEVGGRLNMFRINITDTSIGNVFLTPSAVVGNFAIMYHHNEKHKFFSSLSKGYRAPNIDDMGTLGVIDFRYELPTASLRPERSINMELGYKFNTTLLSGYATLYRMNLRDLITRVRVPGDSINGYPVYQKENTEKGHIEGSEAAIEIHPPGKFRFAGNIAYNYGENSTRAEPMRRIPPIHGRLMANYRSSGWYAAVEWLYAGKQDRLAQGDKDDNRIPAKGTPGWNVFNIYSGYKWRCIQMNGGMQNLINKDYRTHGSGINGVGRSFWMNIIFKL